MSVLLMAPVSIVPAWVLWSLTGMAVLLLGLASRSSRLRRATVVAVVLASVFVLVGFDCGGWVPDWLCFAI